MLFLALPAFLLLQSPTDTAARRAAAERFLDERARACRAAAAADLEGWPGAQAVSLTVDVLFPQQVDDDLPGEVQRGADDLIAGVLQPLGIQAMPGDAARPAGVSLVAIGEALRPGGGDKGDVFNGTWWRGMLSFHARGRCVYSRPFESRTQPPSAAFVGSPSDVAFLDDLEPALLDALVATVEQVQGEAGLSRVAASDADARACLLAVGRMKDQGMLAGLARGAKAPWLRAAAVGKLVDVDRLTAISKTDSSPEVRQAALARLADLKQKQ